MCHAPEGDSKALEAGGLWQSGFLDSPAEGPAPLQFALNPPRASCILQTCAVIHVVIVTSKQGALWFDSKSPVQCPTLLLIRLQALFLPLQTGGSSFGDEPDPASPVLHFPLLGGVVEFDVAGPGDFKPAEFM